MSPQQARADFVSIRNQFTVLGVAEGFFQSRVLFALLKLRVFERIGDGEKSLDELAVEMGARPETLARLLNAGVVLKLLETCDGMRYRLSPVSRSVLAPSAGENYLANWIRNLEYLDEVLSKLDAAVLKSEPVVDPSTHLGSDASQTREFSLAMHNYATLRGKELAAHLDTSGCRSLLDLGCGPGTHAFHLGLANPELELWLLDLPGVLEVTKEVASRYALKSPVRYLPLNARLDEIPGQYDIVLASNILHQFGPEENRKLIQRLYGVVKPGGSLVIQAQFLRDDRLGERWPVVLDLLMLCLTSDGRNHSVQETREWMEEAGFTPVEYRVMSLLGANSFLRGYKRTEPGSGAGAPQDQQNRANL
jgi:SAM-dependent methyltransferase